MTARQLVAVEFAPGGRTYTYHNEGEPVAVGDSVVVHARGGPTVVEVVSLNPAPPKFPTKAIIGKHDRPRAQRRLL